VERQTVISPVGRKYALVMVGAAGLFALLFALTAMAYLYNLRVDLSPGNRFTLSDHALGVLRDVDEPLTITGFIRTEDPRNPILKDLLWQVAKQSGHITYTIVDVNRNPALAAEYGVDAYGSTVVASQSRRTDFSNPSETQIISAILYVTQPAKTVYVVAGHGECSIGESDRHTGCSMMRTALSVEFYDVEELSLLGGREVPDDADVVLMPGPHKDPVGSELEALDRYLAGGGKLMVLLDPYAAPRMAAWLQTYGVEAGDNVVVDPENRLGGGEPLTAAIPERNTRQLVTARLDSPPLFSGTRSIGARPDESIGREAVWLLKSGVRSWASHDPAVLRGTRARFVAGRDLNGPLPVAQEVFMPAAAGDAPAGTRTRLMVFGDSEFVSNRFLDYLGNRDLLLNSVNWLAREERLIAARPRAKKPGTKVFFVSQAELRGVFVGAVIVQPGLFIAFGIALFVWRRLRP